MLTFYTYIIIDVDKMQPIYVGKGKGRRAWKHLMKTDNQHLSNKLRKIANKGKVPLIRLIYSSSESDALNLETQLIREFGRSDLNLGPLTNHTDGGDGMRNPSVATRKKLSKAGIKGGKTRRGSILTEEHKNKLSKKLKGRIIAEDTKKKMSDSRIGRKHSKAHSNSISKALLGHTVSDETRAKLSAALKGRSKSKC